MTTTIFRYIYILCDELCYITNMDLCVMRHVTFIAAISIYGVCNASCDMVYMLAQALMV